MSAVALLIFLILLSGVFSSAHIAFFSLPQHALRQFSCSTIKRERNVAFLLEKPQDLLVTLLFCDIGANLLIQSTFAQMLQDDYPWILKVAIPFLLTLIFGEMLPKNFALPRNQILSKTLSTPLRFAHFILTPIRITLGRLSKQFASLFQNLLGPQQAPQSDEVSYLLDCAKKTDILSSDEVCFIQNYLLFESLSVKHKMLFREDILFYSKTAPLSSLHHLLKKNAPHPIALCQGDIQKIEGVLSYESYLKHLNAIEDFESLISISRPPFFIPETVSLLSLYRQFISKNEQLAFVIDEYGVIVGQITLEDLQKELLGALPTKKHLPLKPSREGGVIASGKLALETFESLYSIKLPKRAGMTTIGGWLTKQMGEIPENGASYQWNALNFKVLSADPKKILEIEVTRIPQTLPINKE